MQGHSIKRTWNWKSIVWKLSVVSAGLIVVAAACIGDLEGEPAEKWMSERPDKCSCDGTTLHCEGSEGGEFASDDFPNSSFCNAGKLYELSVCQCAGTTLECHVAYVMGGTGTPSALATPKPFAYNASLTFDNYAACLDSGSGDGAPPRATDIPQCAIGWAPASGCTCCGSTLICSDGTFGEFNPQCTGGGAVSTPCDPAIGPCS